MFQPSNTCYSKRPTELMSFRARVHRVLFNGHLARLLYLASSAYLIYYLIWRTVFTLNPDALFFSLLLLFAEVFGVINFFLFGWLTWRTKSPVDEPINHRNLHVDIFIPTYNESVEIVEATLVGCNAIRYPHTTFVLDDGNRLEISHLAKRLECNYITRPDNSHAKAGNINHALKHSVGEFIVILDADTVPQPEFLDETLGYFKDDKLAVIQLPQEFYNMDSIQHSNSSGTIWHEQSLFYRVIQPGKNYSNSAFWCGSPSVVRRKALEAVGGVATETITEDIHTSVRLHSRGWKTLFINKVLAYGIAPQTIKSFLLQRLRWAQGTMQLYRSKESPLWIAGLSPLQRLSYLVSFMAYFESFQKFILLATPAIIVLAGIFPMKINGWTFLAHWLLYYAISMLANMISGRGYFRYFEIEKYNLLKMVTFMQATVMLFWKRPLKFKVTPKNVTHSVYSDERRTLRIYHVILGAMTGIILYGFLNLLLIPTQMGLNWLEKGMAMFWASFNASLLVMGLLTVYSKRHERQYYRFPTKKWASLIFEKGDHRSFFGTVQLQDISRNGASLISSHPLSGLEGSGKLRFTSNWNKYVTVPFEVVYERKRPMSRKYQTGVRFGNLSEHYHTNLIEYLYVFLPGIIGSQATEPQIILVEAFDRLGRLPSEQPNVPAVVPPFVENWFQDEMIPVSSHAFIGSMIPSKGDRCLNSWSIDGSCDPEALWQEKKSLLTQAQLIEIVRAGD